MALFDNLAKKMTDAGSSALQKGKELTDIARLNSMISEEDKKITNTYYQIGKLYASIHRTDYESDFEGMIIALGESEARITDLKKQIQDVKGIVLCEKCGAEVPKGTAFCSACGNTMPNVQQNDDTVTVKCEKCGEQVKKGLRFCTNCGNPFTVIAPDTASDEVNTEIIENTVVM